MCEYDTLSEAAAALAKAYALSQRQAYRYLNEAKVRGTSVPVPEGKVVFTVKLPEGLVKELRQLSREQGDSLSELVTQALSALLRQRRKRG